MRRWGLVVTSFYAIVLLALLAPAALLLVDPGEHWTSAFAEIYREADGTAWTWAGLLIAGQVLLLMRVDRSWRKLRPRTRVAVTATMMGGATALLVLALVGSILAAIAGDRGRLAEVNERLFSHFIATVTVSWIVWAAVFSAYYYRVPQRIANAVDWLLTGSVVELLVAVPAHVIVRRRNDCSAPGVTAFGIVTGTAVMLMCFGPGILALFQRRRERYRVAAAAR
jgi:hypothetical protein